MPTKVNNCIVQVCFEKRLVVAHELNSSEAKAIAYGDLGHIHSTLGNFEQAINCLEHQISIARYATQFFFSRIIGAFFTNFNYEIFSVGN